MCNIHYRFPRLSEAFSGASTVPFSQEIIQVLMSSVNENDVEIKPDGTAPVKDGSLFRGGERWCKWRKAMFKFS